MEKDTDLQEEFEETKRDMIGASVRFPEKRDNPNEIGIVTDVYFQPTIDLDDKQERGLIFVSQDELPDAKGNRPKRRLRPKILCRVLFDGCVHMVESKDLILVDTDDV